LHNSLLSYGSAGVGHVSALNHHSLDQQPVLWTVPDAGWSLIVAAFTLLQGNKVKQGQRHTCTEERTEERTHAHAL
uniref:Uncharacterized protein n=1 Tax=Esox lucius TaxID=8010 RepID=A0AAY5KGQ9_ESOLU